METSFTFTKMKRKKGNKTSYIRGSYGFPSPNMGNVPKPVLEGSEAHWVTFPSSHYIIKGNVPKLVLTGSKAHG